MPEYKKNNLEAEKKDDNSNRETNGLPSKETFTNINYLNNYLSSFSNILNTLEIIDYIGDGSEGYVYRAKIKDNNREVILKLLKKKNNEEINISKKLKHINIVNCYGFIEIKKGVLFGIILEYGKHGDLIHFFRKIIKRSCISESLLCYISYQILQGLLYMHKCKIAHFDIKPQNVVIDEYLCAKIIDFSISINYKNIKGNKIKLPFVGTSFFMSPEVIQSNTIDIDDISKVDTYSFGVMLYFLYFGYYPFNLRNEDKGDYNKIYNKKMSKLEFNKNEYNISAGFVDFLEKLLDPNIKKRLSVFEAINHKFIQNAQILYDEKEKVHNASSFLAYLMTDHIKSFEDKL